MKYKIVKDVETWSKVEAMGNYYSEFKNGELWEFNKEFYYLSHLNLDYKNLKALMEYNEGAINI